MKEKSIREPIKQKVKVRSILQQEIDSKCPFCEIEEVGHFQIHHIDENSSNNINSNLILLCPICHSKIHKGDISKSEVEKVKMELPLNQIIECASISMDNSCSWSSFDNIPYAYVETVSDKSRFPCINFSLINHSSKTVLLKEIQLSAKHLQSGLGGTPSPSILKPIANYKIEIPSENKNTIFELMDEIEVPAGRAFKFQVQLYTPYDGKDYPVFGRKVLKFYFKFNNDISSMAPTIFLNCKSEDEKIELWSLG